jgi:hypothetical protein
MNINPVSTYLNDIFCFFGSGLNGVRSYQDSSVAGDGDCWIRTLNGSLPGFRTAVSDGLCAAHFIRASRERFLGTIGDDCRSTTCRCEGSGEGSGGEVGGCVNSRSLFSGSDSESEKIGRDIWAQLVP